MAPLFKLTGASEFEPLYDEPRIALRLTGVHKGPLEHSREATWNTTMLVPTNIHYVERMVYNRVQVTFTWAAKGAPPIRSTPVEIAKDVSSFANSDGGVLIAPRGNVAGAAMQRVATPSLHVASRSIGDKVSDSLGLRILACHCNPRPLSSTNNRGILVNCDELTKQVQHPAEVRGTALAPAIQV